MHCNRARCCSATAKLWKADTDAALAAAVLRRSLAARTSDAPTEKQNGRSCTPMAKAKCENGRGFDEVVGRDRSEPDESQEWLVSSFATSTLSVRSTGSK
mmetsp:Transcript_45531/g.101791  ORF Transcript_45531/g.101791 Transcript_45531/m.101791 type:complete len:100 (-) Transcript_45531:1032-1331(-)